uniref:acid phosphatase n=1 Tax=Acrobeloides nanus TaxID=290746 RepID=A0A914DZ51_9BILA
MCVYLFMNLMAGSSKTKTSEFLSDVSFDETITSSPYLKPIRMKFTRDGQQITWDIGVELDCAVTILYHTEKKALLFVRQFRPPVFVRRVSLLTENVGKPLNEINWSEYPISLGITTECCAGLLDKPGLSPQQIVQEEILEEVGYQVPLEKIKFLKTVLKSVGVTGAFEHLFYTEIDESMKVSEGGGDDTENIEKVYLDLNEAKAILKADVTLSPPAIIISSCRVVAEDKLIFLQAVWRHGDRSPTDTFPTDPNQEATWHQDWGQLSALGMEQHVRLGQTLRQRYIVDNPGNLNLSPSYTNYEIYVRSSDVNRTLISAMSNMIGFYGAANVTAGLDYPDMPEWPGKFVPIAVHTVDHSYDYPMFDALSSITGWNVTLEKIGLIFSAMYIESLYNRTNTSIYHELNKYFDAINKTNDQRESYYVGLDLEPYKGVDFSIELSTLRGGSLLWAIIGNMRAKYDCYTKNVTNRHVCQHWMDPLKYYVWSFHDTTLSSLFATLGFKRSNYNEDGDPQYSSCVTFELWVKDDNSTYIKAYYLPLTNTSDHLIEEPNGDGNTAALCNTNLFNDTSSQTSPSKATSS